jgi:hypothetical protein
MDASTIKSATVRPSSGAWIVQYASAAGGLFSSQLEANSLRDDKSARIRRGTAERRTLRDADISHEAEIP